MFHKSLNNIGYSLPVMVLCVSLFSLEKVVANDTQTLTLEDAISIAQQNDPWLKGSEFLQDSLEQKSVSVSTLPDPKFSFGVANLATDTFNFSQERMTQLKVGVSQLFPRGDSLTLSKRHLQLKASQHPYHRLDHKEKIATKVSELWLETYKAQRSIELIKCQKPLLQQLRDMVESYYESVIGNAQQQDILQAEIELVKLDDRLAQFEQQKDSLNEQIQSLFHNGQPTSSGHSYGKHKLQLNQREAVITGLYPKELLTKASIDENNLYEYFTGHPSVIAINQKIKSSDSLVKLAREKYKPEWGVNASYGYRQRDPFGQSHSDLFSVGVTMDIPLFTANKQDRDVQSALSKTDSVETEKWQRLKNMMGQFRRLKAELNKVQQRQSLYNNKLLPQMREHSKAVMESYSNDESGFSEVLVSKISELNTALDALNIDIEKQLITVKLNYLFASSDQSGQSFEVQK